jgi:LysM repeat protein
MKWLFVFVLALVIFGAAAFFSYNLFVKQEIAVRAEQRSEAPSPPTPDFGLAEFRGAQALKQDGKLTEARVALTAFLERYPTGSHAEEAKDLLGETNLSILLSRYPSPNKEEYVVKKGDVLARVAAKVKSTPELIMRMNNLNGTMLHIGQHLLISHPEFSLIVQRNDRAVVVLDRGIFFKRYHVLEMKLSTRQPPRITTHVAEIMAWKNGKRVGFGSKDYVNSTRWVRLAAPGYILYTGMDPMHPNPGVPPPPQGLEMAAADLVELSTLVNSKTPVTITD